MFPSLCGTMSTTTLTKPVRGALLTAVALLFGQGILAPALAGPEALPDYSKGKNVMEQAAPVCDPRWYISIGGGIDVDLGGTNISHGFTEDFVVDTIFGPAPARAEVKSHDWSDVYDDAWRIQGEIGYVLTRHIELFGLFKYAHADSTSRTTGSRIFVDTDGFLGVLEFPLTTEFEDYTSWGGELGFRYFLCSKESHIRPYLALSGGATHVDSINIETRADLTRHRWTERFPYLSRRFFPRQLGRNCSGHARSRIQSRMPLVPRRGGGRSLRNNPG